MTVRIINADVLDGLRRLPDQSVQCCITSPPYWGLRDYGVEGQIGLEPTPEEYVARIVEVFREVHRVLRDDGTLWLNLGDSYNGSGGAGGDYGPGGLKEGQPKYPGRHIISLKPKDLVGIPWRVAFALQEDGWYLRSDIIWHKPNPMPESVRDRPTKSHEYVFLLTKQPRYFYDADAVREAHISVDQSPRKSGVGNGLNRTDRGVGREFFGNPAGRNRRTVWVIATQPFSADLQTAHYARVGLDAVSDGMTHIVSPNCPVHGGLVDLLTTVICGGRVDDLLSHIERSDTRRVQELLSDCAPTGWNLAQDYGLDNLGSLLRECVRSATQHNMQIHKKGRDPATSPACMPSDGTSFHTDDKQALREFFEQQKSILSNNTLPDELDAHSLGRIPFRNAGILSSNIHNNCLCSFYKSFTKKTDHFATFPEALVEPCIKAGTSEAGCCPVCGAPWARVIDRVKARRTERSDNPNARGLKRCPPEIDSVRTTGWRPSCDHDAAPVPCTVLDLFGGSGTVGAVATAHGRDAVLIELNPDYISLIEKRVAEVRA